MGDAMTAGTGPNRLLVRCITGGNVQDGFAVGNEPTGLHRHPARAADKGPK